MKRLVDSATEATGLEAALAVEGPSRVDLSAIVSERVLLFAEYHRSERSAPRSSLKCSYKEMRTGSRSC